MKKFLLLYFGHEELTPEVREAWMRWFAGVGDRFVDSGNPLEACFEVTRSGRRDLTPDEAVAMGYSIVSAANRDEVERLLEGCPFVSSVRIHEAMLM